MYKIGEFSKIVNIPVRTLRYYDDYGILKPSKIDDFTGYRYYTDDDILECEYIMLLKALNFTLDEIALYKSDIDSDMLSRKQEEILEQIEYLKATYKRLGYIKGELEKGIEYKDVFSKFTNKADNRVLRRKYERRNIRKNC